MSNLEPSSLESFTIASFNDDGEYLKSSNVDVAKLPATEVAYFQNRFRHLSGDLELPLEDKLPGEFEFIEYRIGSDLSGAFVLYYLHDEVVFASLLLSGTNEFAETELMQVFKFLLLDASDEEEPTEEEIESVLSSEQFDFESETDRPIVYQIAFSNAPDEAAQLNHIARKDQQLAAAFFAMDRKPGD